MSTSKKVLITGGAGFIGYWLSRHLASQGQKVTILDNFARGREDEDFNNLISMPNIHFVKGNITKPETFASLATDFDYIYHLAAINGTENFYKIPDKVLKVGVLGTINVLDWFKTLPPHAKLLFSSSSEAYAGGLRMMGERFPIPTPEEIPLVVEDPKNTRWSYGAGKILGEVAIHCYAQAYGIKRFSIIRYHNIYGPRMGFEHVIPQFIERIVAGEQPFKIYGGQETRTFCYIDDGVRATQLVMESDKTDGATIHIGRSDGELTIIDLAKKLFAVADTDPGIEILPAPKGSVMRRCPDVTKLHALGFVPTVELDEGLRRCYAWYRPRYTKIANPDNPV